MAVLDLIVTPRKAEPGKAEPGWSLTDLLGRSMGHIAENEAKRFVIHPDGHALETMAGIGSGTYSSLDAALAEIEKHTRGICRRSPDDERS